MYENGAPSPRYHPDVSLLIFNTIDIHGDDLISYPTTSPKFHRVSLLQPTIGHVAPSKMVSSFKVAHLDRLSTIKPEPTTEITTLATIPKKKKHIVKSIEIAIPKTITFPTPSTPTRYPPPPLLPSRDTFTNHYLNHSHLFRTPITLHIGPSSNSTPFPLHLEALVSISPFFTATFNPSYNFRESQTGSLTLPTHNANDFEYFVQWVYTRTLTHESLDGPHPAYFRLVRLWKLGDWLQVCTLSVTHIIPSQLREICYCELALGIYIYAKKAL